MTDSAKCQGAFDLFGEFSHLFNRERLGKQRRNKCVNEVIKVVVDHNSFRAAEIPKLKKAPLSCMETLDVQRRSLGKPVKRHDVLADSQLQRPEEGCQKPKVVNRGVWISKHMISNFLFEMFTTDQLDFLDWIF